MWIRDVYVASKVKYTLFFHLLLMVNDCLLFLPHNSHPVAEAWVTCGSSAIGNLLILTPFTNVCQAGYAEYCGSTVTEHRPPLMWWKQARVLQSIYPMGCPSWYGALASTCVFLNWTTNMYWYPWYLMLWKISALLCIVLPDWSTLDFSMADAFL